MFFIYHSIMRTSFTIPSELYISVSALADMQNRPIAGIFRQAIEEYLKHEGIDVIAPPVEWGGRRVKKLQSHQEKT